MVTQRVAMHDERRGSAYTTTAIIPGCCNSSLSWNSHHPRHTSHYAPNFLPSFPPSLCRDQLEAVVKSIQDTVKVQETELAEFTVRWEARIVRGGGGRCALHCWGKGGEGRTSNEW